MKGFSNDEALWFAKLDTRSIPELPIDVWIDENNFCETFHGGLIFVYVRNSYNKQVVDFFPMSVEENPRILKEPRQYNVFKKDIIAVKCFVSKYREYIKKISTETIRIDELFKIVSNKEYYRLKKITEGVGISYPIYEMSKVSSDESGLNYDVWVDNSI